MLGFPKAPFKKNELNVQIVQICATNDITDIC